MWHVFVNDFILLFSTWEGDQTTLTLLHKCSRNLSPAEQSSLLLILDPPQQMTKEKRAWSGARQALLQWDSRNSLRNHEISPWIGLWLPRWCLIRYVKLSSHTWKLLITKGLRWITTVLPCVFVRREEWEWSLWGQGQVLISCFPRTSLRLLWRTLPHGCSSFLSSQSLYPPSLQMCTITHYFFVLFLFYLVCLVTVLIFAGLI